MSDIPFHKTPMGRKFIERTVPDLVRQLKRLNDNLERDRLIRQINAMSPEERAAVGMPPQPQQEQAWPQDGPRIVGQAPVQTESITCAGCGFRLEYTQEHVHVSTGRDMDGGSSTTHYLRCPRPSCQHQNVLRSW